MIIEDISVNAAAVAYSASKVNWYPREARRRMHWDGERGGGGGGGGGERKGGKEEKQGVGCS